MNESRNTMNRDSDNGDGGTCFMAPESADEDVQTAKKVKSRKKQTTNVVEELENVATINTFMALN